jgi:hypothetical protein
MKYNPLTWGDNRKYSCDLFKVFVIKKYNALRNR